MIITFYLRIYYLIQGLWISYYIAIARLSKLDNKMAKADNILSGCSPVPVLDCARLAVGMVLLVRAVVELIVGVDVCE